MKPIEPILRPGPCRVVPLALLALTGLAAAAIAFFYLDNEQHRKLEADFRVAARERLAKVHQTLTQAEQQVQELAALYDASREVERHEFATFSRVQHLRVLRAQALEWAPRVRREERDRFERQAQDGLPGFRITERNAGSEMVPAAGREDWFPVFFIEPMDGNGQAMGFDLASEATRRRALERARDEARHVASGPISLVQETDGQQAFLIVHPLYAKGAALETVEQRRRHLQGYVLGVYRFGDLIRAALEGLQPRGVDIELLDLDATPGQQLLYRHSATALNGRAQASSPTLDTRSWREQENCPIEGPRWQAVAIPSGAWLREDHNAPAWVAGVILAATLLTVAYLFDLTRRNRRLQEAALLLRRNQARLEELQRLGKIGGWELDLRSGHLWWSNEVYRMFEVNPARFGASYEAFLQAVHPDDREQVGRAYTDSVKNRIGYDIVHRLRMQDGALKFVRERCHTFYDPQGTPIRSIGTVQDITGQMEAERQLRLAADVFEHTADGILITDASGHIVAVNPAFTRITGYEAEEALGRTPSLLKSDRHGPDFYRELWDTLVEQGQWSGEVWNRRKDGALYPQLQNISSIRDEQGRPTHYVSVFTDISDIMQSQQQLQFLAHHDPLTGLPNRLLLTSRLSHAISRCRRDECELALLFIDLDRFKNVNDALGHPAGDRLLQQVAERFREAVREGDTVARLGGDEFIVLLEDIGNERDGAKVSRKLLQALAPPFLIEGRDVHIQASIGISVHPGDGEDVDTLLRNADATMYRAKEEGRNGYCFYRQEMTQHTLDRFGLENDLRGALDRGELQLYFQPQVRLKDGHLTGAEALLRWHHFQQGMISPLRFIPLAEETGLIIPIGEWVLTEATAAMQRWIAAGLSLERIAVNIAGPQIHRGDLVSVLRRALDSSGLDPARLELEITESFIMHRPEDSLKTLVDLRETGICLSIDDFGTGFSSLAYLKRLPIHKLKIDKSFVDGLPDDKEDCAIASTVHVLGRNLGYGVIAEGVENERQREYLRLIGCDEGQGYLFSPPLPEEEFVRWCREWEGRRLGEAGSG
ncbi:MAG: EAL domain-containing protein [Gammaproteobacteria bacterium]|nr:EAL domain-containing protein [Gammaproteobacteria bacterium]MBU1656419.1 EAL domain-containing protein [Gammaproteobacteria bacterium]MBU1960042.1 EAL domain-containing protein [Gammaproteobacteria bacterium]